MTPPLPPSLPCFFSFRGVTVVSLIWAIGLATGGAVAAAADAPRIQLTNAQVGALRIVTAPVRTAPSQPVAEVPATFMPPPNGRVAVTSSFTGVVTQVAVVEGQSVTAGQVLATVFSRDALTAAAELAQSRAELEVAAAAQRRTAQLVHEGIVAGARGEEADARLSSARAMTIAKTRGLRDSGADASGNYTLRAPIAGRVAHVGPHAGEALDPGVAAFLVDRTDRIQVQSTLAIALIGKVHVGDKAVVEQVEGRVVAVGSAVDPKTRSVSLLAEVPPRDDFVPGRATTVSIFAAPPPDALAVPRSAIIRLKTQPVVFEHRADGYFAVPVAVLGYASDDATIRARLPVGARVATSGVSELKALAEK